MLNGKAEVFASIEQTQYVYQEDGALKFGNSSNPGTFRATLKDGFSLNRVAVTNRTYSRYTSSNGTWSCDKSSFNVTSTTPSQYFIGWPTNEADTSQ